MKRLALVLSLSFAGSNLFADIWDAVKNHQPSDVIRQIEVEGDNVDQRNTDHYTPLMWTIDSQDLWDPIPMVKVLLDRGANINALKIDFEFNIENPLSMAMKHKRFEVMRYLLDKGVSVDFHATYFDDATLNSVIVSYSRAITPLMYAVSYGRLDLVKEFLEKGADVNIKTGVGTALSHATDHFELECAQLLILAGARLSDLSGKQFTKLNELLGEDPHFYRWREIQNYKRPKQIFYNPFWEYMHKTFL